MLVTGASGHVGGAIATHLMENGHEVIGLGRRLTKSTRMLSGAVAADLGRTGLAARLVSEQSRCDAIVHAAAAISLDDQALELSLTNGLGTQQVLELAASWEVEGFVYISSVPVIGRPLELPVNEAHPTNPPTAYHASKLYGEQLVALSGRRGLASVSLRLTAPVGPGMPRQRILPVFIARALSGAPLELAGRGTRGQDYVDVADVASAVAAALERRATGVLNIASGRCVTNFELAETCIRLLDSDSEVRWAGNDDPEDEVRWEVSIAAAQEALDYHPQHTLEDSIAAVADELRDKAEVDA